MVLYQSVKEKIMSANINVPLPINEPVLSYKKDSPERVNLEKAIQKAKSEEVVLPMIIGGEKVYTDTRERMAPPHEHRHTLGYYCVGEKKHVEAAVKASLEAKNAWGELSWQSRAAIFLKAADLIAGPYRAKLNAATMLAQSKNAFQAEIDAACEMIDFLRFNACFARQIYDTQPISGPGMWNYMDYRPLEGFVLAITPFNFTAIAGNLPAAPALMGNTVVWKPSEAQIYSAYVLMEIFMEAGLPAGVINLVYADGPDTGEVVFSHREFAGLHYTGSTGVFNKLWKMISANLDLYRNYPRIVGETGGKDFVLAHKSADARALATALIRGAFEYQGQKCSAASRAYIAAEIWPEVKKYLLEDLEKVEVGSVEKFSNFMNAVINEKAFDKIMGYIEKAKEDSIEILWGGKGDKREGYFIEPTVLITDQPDYTTLREEIFGPVLTIYVYPDSDFDKVLKRIDTTSPYALTGAVFSSDRGVIEKVLVELRDAAGNFYINDKPTGAVVGQQPFGGARASGTNDKAGSVLNLLRWTSPRTVKETFAPPTDFRYPFMED